MLSFLIRVYQSKIFKQKASLQDFCFSSFSHAFQAHGADTPSIAPGGLKVVVGSSNMAGQKKRDEFLANENGSMGQHGGIRRIQNFLLKNQSRTSWFIRFLLGFYVLFFFVGRADSCRWVGQFGLWFLKSSGSRSLGINGSKPGLYIYLYPPRVSNFSPPGLFLVVKGLKFQTLGGFR